jgi:hypothetical protein
MERSVGLPAVVVVYMPNRGEGTADAPGLGYGQPLAVGVSFKELELT